MKAFEYVQEIAAHGSKLDKEAILERAFRAGCDELFVGFQMAYTNTRTYGVKKIQEIVGDQLSGDYFTFEDFLTLAGKLERRELTGHAALDAIALAALTADKDEWNYFYRPVLMKDMRCGCSESTVNKVLKRMMKEDPSAEVLLTPVWKVQLAVDSKNHPKSMVGEKLIDAKLDGMRLTAVLDVERQSVTMHTRNGKVNENFTDIIEELRTKVLPFLTFSVVLDGEVVCANFQELMTMANRKTKVDTSNAHYALFDMLSLHEFRNGGSTHTCLGRHFTLEQFAKDYNLRSRIYVIPKKEVDLDTVAGREEMAEFFDEMIAAGYEGIMVKDANGPYECKRSRSWLKWKPTETIDLTVVDVEEGKAGKRREGKLGALVCEGEHDGKQIRVKVGAGFSDDLLDKFWAEKDNLIGEIVEVKCDILTKSKDSEVYSLRFPRFIRFRSIDGEGKF